MGANSRFSTMSVACKSMSNIFLVALILLAKLNVPASGAYSSAGDGTSNGLCSTHDLSAFLPLPYGDASHMACQSLWNSYLLRYSQTEDNVVTIILSTIYTSGWVGIGFSRDGMMLNASCMVGWVKPEGIARIKQYHVKGFTPEKIVAEKGELPLTSVPPYVAVNGATIYLAFQLKYPTRLRHQPVLLAFSSKYPKHHLLTLHDDKTTIQFDFSSGKLASETSVYAPAHGDLGGMRKTHGTLAMMGWGLFIPFGAIFARYLRHRDPLWYYLHVIFQFVGFILGLAAVVVGLSLVHKLHAHIAPHKGIGIFVFVLSILQVLAFFARPNKDSKNRGWWNLYHHWVGRLAMFFATVNTFLGMHYAGAGASWKIGYGFLLGVNLLSWIVLEVLSRLKRSRLPDLPPASQMNTF